MKRVDLKGLLASAGQDELREVAAAWLAGQEADPAGKDVAPVDDTQGVDGTCSMAKTDGGQTNGHSNGQTNGSSASGNGHSNGKSYGSVGKRSGKTALVAAIAAAVDGADVESVPRPHGTRRRSPLNRHVPADAPSRGSGETLWAAV